jgi:LmbE family N-acetylglucosaminyl deacetylase
MRSVAAIGARAADITAGCGGTLAAHRAAGDAVTMLVMSDEGGAEQARALDCLLLRTRLDGLDGDGIAAIENVLTGVAADVIYVNAPDDSHAERRSVAAATLAAARHGSRVLHYRGTSTLRFEPSVFVDISAHLDRKLEIVEDAETAAASARHFGALARVRYAEAFAPTRFVWDL